MSTKPIIETILNHYNSNETEELDENTFLDAEHQAVPSGNIPLQKKELTNSISVMIRQKRL